MESLAEKELGLSVRRGKPVGIDGLEREKDPWSYAAVAGALIYAYRNDEGRSFLDGILGRFFK